MTNLEFYKEDLTILFENADGWLPPITVMFRFIRQVDVTYRNKTKLTIKEAIDWLADEYHEPILDGIERKYLGTVIKPFKNKIISIEKRYTYNQGVKFEYIRLNYSEKYGESNITLPWFKPSEMYKSMELDKKYSLEDLGL